MDAESIEYQILELGGERYAVVPEGLLRMLGERAGVGLRTSGASGEGMLAEAWDGPRLGRRLNERRRRVGITQAELARRAGVRVETLNRVERGRTTPDFATVRKLVAAITEVEASAERQ